MRVRVLVMLRWGKRRIDSHYDPPLTHRAPEGDDTALRFLDTTIPPLDGNHCHACSTELTSSCVYGCCGSSST